MPGGVLNIAAEGSQNIILNGNPDKTFFKTKYSKYTNFGLQKFRIDYNGLRNLKLSDETKLKFKIGRYGDLLMDTYLVITLPNIWSPIYPPNENSKQWVPYEFKWIDNIGCQLIKEVEITCSGALLQKYSGSYLMNMVDRDFSAEKKELFNKMTGNVNELKNPADCNNRINTYPNAFYNSTSQGGYPSIDSRKLYIPINTWFTMSSKMALPLVALQNAELNISVTLRSIQQLFTIKDVIDFEHNHPRIQPNFTNAAMAFYRFLQPPPSVQLNDNDYGDKRVLWDADIHLLTTQCFLSNDERNIFAVHEQKYLIKEIHEYQFNDIVGTKKVKIPTSGMVSNWMFTFQRNDIYLRNEWSNTTNWPYNYLPSNVDIAPYELTSDYNSNIYGDSGVYLEGKEINTMLIGPGLNPNATLTNLYITPTYSNINTKDILMDFGILIDGNYRENTMDSGVYNYVEKYVRTNGNGKNGLYCYNFAINSNPYDTQPSGAMNLSMFKNIELEISTIIPEIDPLAVVYTVCDENGNLVGINKPSWIIYDYTFNMNLFEERYNILTFIGGNCSLQYAR